jgi:glutamate synthase domain-containing protein 1
MCGIVGIYAKTPAASSRLGLDLASMLVQMADRGPDSAGVAIYRDPVAAGHAKLTLHATAPIDWDAVAASIGERFTVARLDVVADGHALLVVEATPEEAAALVGEQLPEIEIASAGTSIEIYKEAIQPAEFVSRFGLESVTGTHAIGHTRMATESRVTTAGSHPFSTGRDLCLVHNGSLSNHSRLRDDLRQEGIAFRTDNDSEVAAGDLTWQMRSGASLEQALESCLDDLDGFYTFAVGTADGFAVLRDPIACKPAVMAETDDWVAIASEYRALAQLPGADDAQVWEPEPATVYSWGTEVMA